MTGGPVTPAPPHVPVLLASVVEHLAPRPGARFLDCTCGAGGHARALMAAGAQVDAVDRDPRARSLAAEALADYAPTLRLIPATFAQAAAQAVAAGQQYDGVLADLGVSSMQLDDPQRGFGIRSLADADMRMGDQGGPTALDFIDAHTQEELAEIIRSYGEERLAGRVARHLKEARAAGLSSAADLAAAVRAAIPGRHGRHPALRTFQALRIAVNGELDELTQLLGHLPDLLADCGRVVIISFHSLEDRLVKNSFRDGRRDGVYSAVARRVVTAEESEVAGNRRAASAKLRWAQRAIRSAPQGTGAQI